MNKSFTRKLLVVCTFGCMATVAIAGTPPVQLHIDAPNSNGGLVLLSESGWPLTIKMVVDFPEGEDFPAYAVQPNYAVRGRWGFIIFDDPDECLNPPAPLWYPVPTPECGWLDFAPADWVWEPPESDEVYMEFWPDVDMAGVEDYAGNADRQADLLDSAGSRGPEFQKRNADTCVPGTNDVDIDGNCIKFGPDTGGDIKDGFGFGADDDISGLVIIAEYGVGRVFNEPAFELSDPIGAVNLAGLVNSVTYDLSDLNKEKIKVKGKPTVIITEQARIWAHMNMDNDVLRHLIQYDACTGNINWRDAEGGEDPGQYVDTCDGKDWMSIDGGEAEPTLNQNWLGELAAIDLLESTTYTLKVFLVAGQAPNRLFDEDGDGDVDSADAVLAGLILLSNEDSISLLQLSQLYCAGGGSGSFYGDLDGNGEDGKALPVCPAGPGTISRPPR